MTGRAHGPMRRGPVAWGAAVLLASGLAVSAAAQTPENSAEILERATEAVFHIEVTGTPSDPANPTQEAARSGKAFAIGPEMLVTALNVVGDETEWMLARTTRDEVTRAVRPLSRTVQLTDGRNFRIPPGDVLVLAAPARAVDAAGIMVPDLKLKDYFHFSMCDIVEGQHYSALMTTSQQPGDARSVERLELVPLIAAGYRPGDYGALYLFESEGAPPFAPEPWGHGGSPILDADGNVVALISAVTVTGGGPIVLATPISPLFPGLGPMLAREPENAAATQAQLKCSMVDAVRQVRNQLKSHAIWSISPRPADNPDEVDIVFEYDSAIDPPNISSIEVRYMFFGTEVEGLPAGRIPHRPAAEDVITLRPNPKEPRTFVTSEIARVGRVSVANYVKPGNGAIEFVRLMIKAHLTTGEIVENRTKYYDIQWSDLD